MPGKSSAGSLMNKAILWNAAFATEKRFVTRRSCPDVTFRRFGVEIEAECRESEGAMDVLLLGENNTIAVEVSVTTSPHHELENLKKCLNETVDQVLCVSPDNTHRLNIQNLCIERLPQNQLRRVYFLSPQNVPDYLAQFDERETTLIRGYEVITRTAKSDPRDVGYRKSRIRQVLKNRES
jgi:hypothetical protein